MKIKGIITAWFPRSGYGYVTARTGKLVSRYFLHISSVISLDENLTEPTVGCSVSFEPTNDLKRKLKDIPSATDAEVSAPPTPTPEELLILKALSGYSDKVV
jgi:hypothetical protein